MVRVSVEMVVLVVVMMALMSVAVPVVQLVNECGTEEQEVARVQGGETVEVKGPQQVCDEVTLRQK